MQMEQFMKEIEYQLGNMSKQARDEILEDFAEHFNVAKAEGRSEAEICAALGDPAEIAKQFAGQYRTNSSNNHTENNRQAANDAGAASNSHEQNTGQIHIYRVFDAQQVRLIQANLKTASISVDKSSGNEISVLVKGYSMDSVFKVNSASGEIVITEENEARSLFFLTFLRRSDVVVTIYVPESFNGKLVISSSSGNASVRNSLAESIELRATAGTVMVSDCRSELTLNSKAGNVDIVNHEGHIDARCLAGIAKIISLAGNVSVVATAGDIKIKSSTGNMHAVAKAGNVSVEADEIYELKASSSAGNVKIDAGKTLHGGEISSAAGNVRFKTGCLEGEYFIKTSAGNVDVIVPQETNARIHAKISMGSLNCRLRENPNSTNALNMKSSMGNISVLTSN